jgi:AraC-like DNA-binding protein
MDAFDAARDNPERIRALEQFFMPRLGLVKAFSGKEALLEIISSRGKISIGELSADLNISARKLQRIFKEAVGVSAKTYQRLVRFSNAYAMLQKEQLSKTEVAYVGGYFDQSHFNLDFKSFAGEDPSSYFGKPGFLCDQFMKD